MNPWYPKGICGCNGSERPGAVYLAATKAAHDQKGLPVFSIYGSEVQGAGDDTIPQDVKEKILRFVKAGLTVAEKSGKSYLSIESVCMGLSSTMVHEDCIEVYLGSPYESVDMSDVV